MSDASTFVVDRHMIQFPPSLPSKEMLRPVSILSRAYERYDELNVTFQLVADREPVLGEVLWRFTLEDGALHKFVATCDSGQPYMSAAEAQAELMSDPKARRNEVPLELCEFLNGQLMQIGRRITRVEVTWKRPVDPAAWEGRTEIVEMIRYAIPIGRFEAGTRVHLTHVAA